MSETPTKKSKKASKDEKESKDKGKDSKKKELEKKKSEGLSPNSKGKYSDETSKSPSSGKKKTKISKSKDKKIDSSRIEDSTPKKNIKDKEKKKIKIKDKKKKNKNKEVIKEKQATPVKEKSKVSKSVTPPKQIKNRKSANTAPISNEYDNDYDYSTNSQVYSDDSQDSNYDNYSASENENGNESRGTYGNEEYSDDSHEAESYNENEAYDFVQALNSMPDFERKIKFHIMPETIPLIPTSKSMKDGSTDEIGIGGGQFDLLGKDLTKKNDERGFKINTFPLKNIFNSSNDHDINAAFHIDIFDNDSQDVITPNMDNDQNSDFNLNDDIEFEDDISSLPSPMQISLRAMRSCINQLSNVLTDAGESTKIYFQVAGMPNEKLEKDFRSIEKDRSNLIHERQFKQFTKCDVIGTVSSIIKL